jgi:ATP-binding cassette, subfamily B, multidrug efflux pump
VIDLLRKFLRPYRREISIVVVLLFAQTMANLYLPSLNADIINKGVVTGDIGVIVQIGLVMLAVTLVLGVISIVTVYFSARTAMAFGRDVRTALFTRVEAFSLRELDHFGTPSLITRNTNDVQQVQMLVFMGMTMLVVAPLTAIGGVIMALRTNVPLSALLLGLLMARAVPLFRSMQLKIDRINEVLREALAGVRVIRAFVRTRQEEERFAEANADLTGTTLKVTRLFALMMPALMLIMNASSVAVIWFGARLVDSGSMQIGDLTAFLQYIALILFSVMLAVMMFVMIPRAAASAERIGAVLDTVPDIVESSDPTRLPDGRGKGLITFDHVRFCYPGAEDPVLDDLTFALRPGWTTAIVGGTGSGKTTLLNLIPRLYDTSSGAVRFDGVDVRELAQSDLWGQLALVPQRAFLFSGTVASNVRFGRPDATDAEVWHALETAQAADFVRTMAEGLDSPVDQGGANLSGGQRQRLAIARALVRRAPVYLFDDSFSALDYATDARLRIALKRNVRDATVVIVAQRVSTILHADQIIVLDDGRAVGIGTHHDLLTSCETYREIVESQLIEETPA